ncbi:unnamed protein product [Leptidea sinapis]|uniref:Uncharacterized protein n=1 Tax=Leptidea sinapis TaxID=189913 RepID=A0A5E4R687_9NEOP|nr:unnamed protein product [Leptidea sinapis]
MREKWNFILYLIWFSYLILSAVLLFGHGFLLSRKTLNDISQCVSIENACEKLDSAAKYESCQNEKLNNIVLSSGSAITCSPIRNRVVFILVDALRYDFTEFNGNLENPLYYQNRLPIIHETVTKRPNKSRVFRFMADPPTTTLQRIKALVTGSLPTFVDASSNFAAMELHEDNIIDQIYRNNLKAVLLGDDTWERLLPGRWLRSHTMYSFHTWDLDTVDTAKDDWDILIAHYLGVDHAGHRYGPNHPEMARKLDETNERLKKIIEALPTDAILYVIGDHGMTETGDHGGETKAERTAAIFAYYGGEMGGAGDDILVGREIQQTDLAPTITSALGTSPPAPSLGTITQYLVRYGEESQQVSLDRLAELINVTRDHIEKIATVKTDEQLQKYISDVRSHTDNIRTVFREVWVEFDSLAMMRSLLLLLLAIFFNWIISEGIPLERIPLVFSSSFVPTGLVSVAICISVCYSAFYFALLDNLESAIILSTGLISGTLTCALVILHWDGITQKWYEGRTHFYERFARTALFASAAVLVSNSYIIEEGTVLSYLSLSVLGLIAWNVGTVKALGLWASCGLALALTRSYRGCREEQGDCWTSGQNGLTGEASRGALVLALGSVAATVSIARRNVNWRGYGVVLAGIFTCAHFAVGWGSLGSLNRSRLLARVAWLFIVTSFGLLLKKDRNGPITPLIICSLLFYLRVSFAPTAALALLSGFLSLNVVSMLKNDATSKLCMPMMFGASVPLLALYGRNDSATLGPRMQMAAVFACALSATIHCRHLMIWGVFTPKLIFEAGSCVAALAGTLLGALITVWHLPKQTKSS